MSINLKITVKVLQFLFYFITLTNVFVVQTSKIVTTTTTIKPKQNEINMTATTTTATASILTINDFLIENDPAYMDDDVDDTDAIGDYTPDEYDYEADEYFDGRIVGGSAVSIRQFPFQVSLQYNKEHICGGAIIASNLVITAAHCIEKPQNINLYRLRVGSSHHKQGGQLVGVRRIIPHEQYSALTLDNDVAIIVLASRLSFNQNVKRVPVAKQTDAVPAKRRLFISGWGLTSETGTVTPVLRYASVRLLNDAACTNSYRAFTRITPRMFCASSSSGGRRDSCQGDSGGPLITYVRGKPKLFGVVSWGIGCAQKGFPGVYAKVSALRPWINSRILELRQTKMVVEN